MSTSKKKALLLLKNSDKTVYEMTESLKKSGFSEYDIRDTIEYLKNAGYMDDVAYTRRFVEMSMDKRRGPLRITNDLKHKGIDAIIIDDAITNMIDDQWESNTADLIAENIRNTHSSLSSEKLLVKIINKLTYEGFHDEIINEIVETFFSD